MTPSTTTETQPETRTESYRVYRWREEQLRIAGYPDELAMFLAIRDTDLHHACDLIERGCPPSVAVEILT